jgi:lysyl-tRNA synthetase class 2
MNLTRAIDSLWKHCRKQIAGPGFLINVPVFMEPLAKRNDQNPALVDRFQVILAGSEMGKGFSELNDPIDQAGRFADQAALREAGDDEAQMNDTDFVEALEYGMPPTCGFGFSERLFWFLMNKSARECQIFPLMKPKENELKDRNLESEKVIKPHVASSFAEAMRGKQDKSKISDEDVRKMNEELGEVGENRLGISYEDAQAFMKKYITDKTIYLHCLETEIVMRALARHLGENEEEWGTIGLLHDLDWELTREDVSNHGVKVIEILKEAGATQFLINAIISHVYGHESVPHYLEMARITKLEHLLAAGETVTGLIVACAKVRPDKSLAGVELSSLKKKFTTKAFAANCDREVISECEQAGLKLDEFLSICLEAMKERAGELGL